MMEKQVGFVSRVDIMTPGWPMAILPDHILGDSQISSSPELEWSEIALPKLSSVGYSRVGSQRSTHRGNSNSNYGYSTAERPNKPGLLSFSNDDHDSGKADCCAWVYETQLRWTVACWTCIALLSLFILAVLAMIITWCIIIPRRPYMDLLDEPVHVQSVTVSPGLWNASGQQGGAGGHGQLSARFSASFTLQFLVNNPNRVATDYSASRFSVSYRGSVVGNATVSAFSQEAHATSRQPVHVLIANVHVLGRNADTLLTDATLHDSIPLEFDGRLYPRLQVLGLSTPPVRMKLRCSFEIKKLEKEVTNQQCRISHHKVIW